MKVTNKMQLYTLIYYSWSALHVSGDVFAHHQVHLTVFTVSDSIHPRRCRLVSWGWVVTATCAKIKWDRTIAQKRNPTVRGKKLENAWGVLVVRGVSRILPHSSIHKYEILIRKNACNLKRIPFQPQYYLVSLCKCSTGLLQKDILVGIK